MKTIIFAISLLALFSCQQKKQDLIVLKKQDPVPQTITLQEVARIAIVEAEQFIKNAKNEGLDYSSILEVYNQAKLAYKNGEFKSAQISAVKTRQMLQELIHKK